MHKTYSSIKMDEVMYKVGTDGRANVWIRENQEEVAAQAMEGEEAGIQFTADEVYFTVTPDKVVKAEIESAPEYWFDCMKEKEDGADGDEFCIDTMRAAKLAQVSKECNEKIVSGVDVTLSTGTEHFSLTETDQLNLFGKQAELAAGITQCAYHKDGQPCKYYSVADMKLIIEAAISFVTFNTTKCNSMFSWIRGCSTAAEMAGITFESNIPEKYWSDVYKDLMAAQSA